MAARDQRSRSRTAGDGEAEKTPTPPAEANTPPEDGDDGTSTDDSTATTDGSTTPTEGATVTPPEPTDGGEETTEAQFGIEDFLANARRWLGATRPEVAGALHNLKANEKLTVVQAKDRVGKFRSRDEKVDDPQVKQAEREASEVAQPKETSA